MNIKNLATERKTVSEGLQLATIISTAIRTSKESGRENVNICFKTPEGTFFDTVTESEENIAQLKLYNLLQATGVYAALSKKADVTLKDIAKAITGKTVAVYVSHSKATEEFASKPQVNINTDMFISEADFNEIVANSQALTDDGTI